MATIDIALESTSQEILSTIKNIKPKRYGFKVRMTESSPSNRVTYLYDAEGKVPAYMNFNGDNGTFNYGDWGNIWFVKNNYPCMVRNSGTVDYQLNPNDYTKRADNNAASDVSNVNYNGNAMSAIPCIWYKRWTDGDYYYFSCCEEQYDDSYYADVHTDNNGIVQPYKYIAMFKGSVDTNNKLRSLKDQAPMSGQNASTELTYANNNGSEWTIKEWGVWNLIADLLILISKTTNAQAAFGQGHTTGGSSASDFLTTGTLSSKGQFFGYNDTTHAMKVFHLENWWGDRWDRIVGFVVDNGIVKTKMNSYNGDYNLTGTDYNSLGDILSSDGGWQIRQYSGREGTFPVSVGGSDSTYECDYFWINKGIVAVSLVGGDCNAGSGCGPRYVSCHRGAGYAGWTVGASLSIKNTK